MTEAKFTTAAEAIYDARENTPASALRPGDLILRWEYRRDRGHDLIPYRVEKTGVRHVIARELDADGRPEARPARLPKILEVRQRRYDPKAKISAHRHRTEVRREEATYDVVSAEILAFVGGYKRARQRARHAHAQRSIEP